MGFQPQLLSKKRFDEHRGSLPLGAPMNALTELDEPGIHASHSPASRCMNDTSTPITLLEQEPKNQREGMTAISGSFQRQYRGASALDSYRFHSPARQNPMQHPAIGIVVVHD